MTVLFLCPHAAAKSLMARALFAREANARGLSVPVDCAGTDPDTGPMPEVVELLAAEGIDVAAHTPRKVTAAEIAAASRVISLGCDLDGLLSPGVIVDDWNDVPLPSQDLAGVRRIVGERVKALAEELARTTPRV